MYNLFSMFSQQKIGNISFQNILNRQNSSENPKTFIFRANSPFLCAIDMWQAYRLILLCGDIVM